MVRKTSRKSSRKGGRKTSRKSSRKSNRKSSRKSSRKTNCRKGEWCLYKDGYKCKLQGTVFTKNGIDPYAVFKCGKKQYVSSKVEPKRLTKVYISKDWD